MEGGSRRSRPYLVALLLWFVAALALTASRLAWAAPESMRPLLEFPLGLLPTFLVPLLLASHVWLFSRMRQERL
jgi:hypothetical protein